MKWDIFVYARGVQRTDGYKLRAQPENFPPELIQGCQTFFNIRGTNEKRSTWKDVFEKDPCAWKKSFAFILMPKYKSCALVRAVKAEGENDGEVLMDFENREIWSLEGIWCPYEKRRLLFASLPSILMWFRSRDKSLRYYVSKGEITNYVDVPDEFYFNPYDDDSVLPLNSFSATAAEATILNNLSQKIRFSPEPFALTTGPLAELIMKSCSAAYNLKECFPENNPDSLSPLGADPFNNIETAKIVRRATGETKRKNYVLQLCIDKSGKREEYFRWRIAEKGRSSVKEVLSAEPIPFDGEKGLSMLALKSEAEAVRFFASNMQWTVEQASDDEDVLYSFVKEG